MGLTPVGANWGTDGQELNIIFININELTLLFGGEDGSQQVVAAARPVHPLGKCLASVPLLAWVLVAKYADALPLYRLEGILKRHGGRISRTTLANWIIRLDDVFQPLINLLPIPTIVTADSTDRDRCTHRVPTGVVFLR